MCAFDECKTQHQCITSQHSPYYFNEKYLQVIYMNKINKKLYQKHFQTVRAVCLFFLINLASAIADYVKMPKICLINLLNG